jgi:signal transduction histidine kinase
MPEGPTGSVDQTGESRSRVILPQMRLDDLLAELQTRLNAVLATRDRVHALLEAVVSIGGDLDLEIVLRRIAEAATALAGAKYGALGVIGDGGRLTRFVTVGVTEREIEKIGQWPHGHGILGVLIREPRTLRLADLTNHPDSYGFPANHPPMRRFLGVPIRVRDEVFGNLYLTEKLDGGEFEEDDQIAVTALASAAGVAIENARLYQDTRRRERWLEASGEVSTALLSGTDPDEVLALVARRARRIPTVEAELAVIGLPDTKSRQLVVEVADGENADSLTGMRIPIADSGPGQVYREGAALALADAHEDPALAEMLGAGQVGPALLVPLGVGTTVRGVLGIANTSRGTPFDEATRRMLEAFAAQAAVAMELAERRRDAERLVVLVDRDRIAKDLHDTVIQRLFATAMTLMSATKVIEQPDAAVRVRRAVDDLDDTIRQIRSTIFALQATDDQRSLRTRIHGIVDSAAEGLGFAPSVRLDGLLDTVVAEDRSEHLLAVLHEALSNVTRHAGARKVSVEVEVGDRLVLRVVDDGVGVREHGRRSGMRNMEERARALGGSFSVQRREEGGTALEWTALLA